MGDQTPPRRLLSPMFLIAVVLLLIAAVSFRPTIASLTSYYSKEPIPLRKPIDLFNGYALPSFTPIFEDTGMVVAYGDVETDDLLTQSFELKDPGPEDGEFPTAMLVVTYYSDPRYQVPHTPEVCYRQAGVPVTHLRSEPFDADGLDGGPRRINGLGLDVDAGHTRLVIVYVLCTNGEFYDDREKARLAIGWPGDKYTYFSKIEAVARYEEDGQYDAALARCKRLLSEALPVLLADHFPSKVDVQRRQ
jgi:hypothetical protein